MPNIKKNTHLLVWDELIGKHSEGWFEFSDETLRVLELPSDVVKILYKELGKVVSGPFDFEFFDKLIEKEEENYDE